MAFGTEAEESVTETEPVQETSKDLEDLTMDDVIEEESSEYITVFDLGGNQRAKVFTSYPVHYEDESGQLAEVEPELVSVDEAKTTEQGNSLSGYAYENKTGKFKQYIPKSLSENTPVLMESEEYSISMTPTGWFNGLLHKNQRPGKKKEEAESLVGETEEKELTAVYDGSGASLEYTSLADGVKESIILSEAPKKNEFSYKLVLKGLTAKVNDNDEGITFYDKTSGEIAASIDAPFMNDATGEAYSDAIQTSLKKRGNSGQYTLTFTVDQAYLNDSDRVYPVTIDPTATWTGSSQIHDAYIISSSPTYNYYSSETKIMPSGRGSSGSKYRTCINIIGLRGEMLHNNITSAYFDIYETGNSSADRVVRVYKILESWSPSSVTWNTCPDYGTATSYLAANDSTGTANKRMRFDVTDRVSGIAGGGSNFGLMLKNQIEASSSYTEFYGSRTGSTSYRPKLTVTYTEDKPTTASGVTASKSTYNVGENISVTWNDITANSLSHIEYRVAKYDDSGTLLDDYYVPYTRLTSAKSTGTAVIPGSSSFPEGRYGIYIRGVSTNGVNGTGKRSQIITVSKDKPATPTSVTVTPNPASQGQALTVSWTGLTAGSLSEIQYRVASYDEDGTQLEYAYVPYTKLNVTPASSGSAVIPGSNAFEAGCYKVFIRGINGSGVKGTGKGSSLLEITDNEEPTVGALSVTIGGTPVSGSTYVSPGSVSVLADRISDEEPIKASNLSYSLYGPAGNQIGESLSGCTIHTNSSDGTNWTVFTLPQSAVSASGSYTLYFWVFDDFGNLGYAGKTFLIDNTAPYGNINVRDSVYGTTTDVITGNGLISVSAGDAHSGVNQYTLSLYRGTKSEPGEKVEDLITGASASKNINLDSAQYDNGSYCLKLVVTDKVGLSSTLWKDITIDKPMEKPGAGITMEEGGKLKVSWGFQSEKTELDYMQYSLDGGPWNDVEITGKTSGEFIVTLDESLTGTHYILVRGIEEDGTAGDSARVDFTMDTEAPTVHIFGISHDIITGTVTDDNLKAWTVYVKGKDEEDAAYVQTASGSKSVENGRIALAGLSSDDYDAGWYTVKIEAVDQAGNTAKAVFDVEKAAGESYAQLIPSAHRILRGLGQDLSSSHFIVSSSEDALRMTDAQSFVSGAWFLDGNPVSSEKDYTADFSSFEEGRSYNIKAAGKDGAGQLYFSNDIYTNAASITCQLPEADENGQYEMTVPFPLSGVGFTLESEAEGVTWYGKRQDGTYMQLTPDTLTYFLQLDEQKIGGSTLSVKAEADEGVNLAGTSFTIQLAVMDQETFEVSSAESCWPENITAQDKINYKTYVRWDIPEETPEGLSYEVHRSTIENFVPGDATLVAEDVTDGYWCDINTNYSISLYYKVRAVIKDSSGRFVSASSYSDTAESTPVDRNEYSKALGHKEYWAYAEVATPSGNGYIEKSQGNFLYEQTDGELPNEQLPVELTRTYNSMATSKSAFGYGWTHSYDIELLKLGSGSNPEEGILVLRDGSGTLYQFKAEGDSYISSMGKYVNLLKEARTHNIALGSGETVETMTITSAYTMTTRDNLAYYFDESGKLVYLEESNGNLLIFHYDEKRGLLDKITTGNNISIEFTYNESAGGGDALTIHDMTLPDGQKIVYNYQDSYLTSVTRYPAGQASGGITYSYGYTGKKMTSLTDGKANAYSISYGNASGQAAQFTYPSAGGASEAVRVSRDTQDGSALTEKLVGSTVVKKEKDYFDTSGQCIRHTDYSGSEELNTYYEYKDSLITKETAKGSYGALNKDGNAGSVVMSEYDKVKTYEYDDDKEVVSKEIDEDTAVSDYLYTLDGLWTEYQPTGYTEVTADGVTTAQETYQYDANGNLTRVVDQVGGTFTNYSYFTGAADSAKGALKSEAEYLISDGTLLSSTDISIELLSENRKKETTTTVSSGNKTISEVIYDVMGRELSAVTYTYTAFGTEKETISKEQNTYTYDGFGRVTGITTTTSKVSSDLTEIAGTAHTVTETKSYDANGTLVSETAADGVTSSYQYDAMNRVTSTTRSSGGLTQVTTQNYSYGDVAVSEGKAELKTYSNALMITESTDGLETGKTYQDGTGQTVRQVSDGVVTDYSYDLSGNALTEYIKTGDNSGILTLHVFDKEGNETATLQNPVWDEASGCYSLSSETICQTASYDAAGNLTSQTDGKNLKTQFSYDDQSRITGVTLPGSTAASYAYSEYGEEDVYQSTVTQTLANGAVSVETADADGNILSVRDQGTSGDTAIETRYVYDAFGNVTEERHSDGGKIIYQYDAKGRVSEKTQYSAGGSAKWRTVYTYYSDDQLKEIYDYKVSGTSQSLYHYVRNTYDGLKRLTAKAEINGSSVPSDLGPYTAGYSYDLKDRLTAVSYGSAAGSEVDGITYTYDGSRLKDVYVKVGSSSYLAKAYSYDSAGRVSSVKDYYNFRAGDTANYILLTYAYDSFGRVIDMKYTKAGETIEQHSYEYDKNSNIVSENNVNGEAGLDEVREYTYDDLGQLKTSAIKDRVTTTTTVEGEADEDGNPTTVIKTEVTESMKLQTAYTYDSVGNRTKKTENGTTTNYTYNGLNQLLTENGGGVNLTYSYDANGNQTAISGTAGGSSVSKTYTYTPDNMLASYTDGTVTQENLYSGEGQRVQKKEGNDVTNYFYQNGSVLYTADGSGSLKSFNLLNVSDIFGTERKSGTGEDYYLYTEDLRGSTVNVLDSSAEAVVSYWYNDFGEAEETKAGGYSSFVNEVQYTGGINDSLTGLLYLNARFYDPQTGRFISRDTYRGERDDAGTWHLYLYCANDPVNYVDPSGNFALSTGVIAALTAALIAATAYMSTTEFQQSWRDFCTTIGNGLSSIGNQLRQGAKKVWNGTKSYVQNVQASVQSYTTVANAQSEIRARVKNKKHGSKYFTASLKKSGKYSYVAIGKGLTRNQAISRIKAQKNVFAVSKEYAKSLANHFWGVKGPEIDKGKKNTIGYFYHYHVWNRKNKAHIWFYI